MTTGENRIESSASTESTGTADDRNSPGVITFKDVLRAIFFPPRDDLLNTPAMSVARALESAASTLGEEAPLPEDLSTPSVVRYDTSPVEPVAYPSPARVASTGIGMIVAILISYLAQSAARVEGGIGAGLLFLISGLVWLGLLMFEIAPPDGGLLRRGPLTTGGGAARPVNIALDAAFTTRVVLASLAFALCVATYVYTADNTFTLPGIIGWVGSTLLWMLVVAERNPDQLAADWLEFWQQRRWLNAGLLRPRLLPLIAFVVIMGAAIFFRVYHLDAIPNEMTSDHVEKLLDANDVAHGIYHVFFTRNAGREALQFYVVPLVGSLFQTGMSFMSLKIATVLEALALIPLMILLGREVVDRETGFFAAALVSVSWWHTLLGRLGLRIILTPFLFTLVVITLIRGIRTGSRKSWIWAGFWLGVGAYSYQAMRLAPLVAIAAFLVSSAGPVMSAVRAQSTAAPDSMRRQIIAANIVGRQALNLLAAGIVALAMFVPMLRVWHDYPTELWNRVINRTTESERDIDGSTVEVFVGNYVDALGMYNVRGDVSWFSSVPNRPTLDPISGALLALGIIAWLVRLRIRRDPADLFIVLAGLLMLLPSALSIAFPIENPSTTRASATIPVVFLIAAWPLVIVRQRWTAVLGRVVGTVLVSLLLIVLFAGAGLFNYQTFFQEYATSYRNSALNPGEVADAVREHIGPGASLEGVWLQGWPFWHDYRAIGIEAGDLTFDNAIIDVPMLTDYLSNYPEQFASRPLIFIVHPQDEQALDVLETNFADGKPIYYTSETEGRDFVLFVVGGD